MQTNLGNYLVRGMRISVRGILWITSREFHELETTSCWLRVCLGALKPVCDLAQKEVMEKECVHNCDTISKA